MDYVSIRTKRYREHRAVRCGVCVSWKGLVPTEEKLSEWAEPAKPEKLSGYSIRPHYICVKVSK